MPPCRMSIIFAIVLASTFGSTDVHTASADLIGHITFDDSAGSVNGINGTFEGDARLTSGNGGISGESLALDGTGDYVSFASPVAGNPVLGSLTSFTVSLWLKTEAQNDAFDRLVAVFRHNEDDFQFGNFQVAAAQFSFDKPGFEAQDLLPGNDFNVGASVTLDQWQHFAVVVDQDANLVTLYLDGTDGAMASAAIVESDFVFSDNDRVFIGAGNNPTYGGGLTHFFAGFIDDVQFYDSALTGAQIDFLETNPGSTIPEPSTITLFSMAGLVGAFVAWRKRRRT